MNTIFHILDKQSHALIWRLSIVMFLIIFTVSLSFGDVFLFGPLYAIPITLSSWYGSKYHGVLLTSLSSLFLSYSSVFLGDGVEFQEGVVNGLVYFIAYMGLAIIITNFRNVHRVEVVAADTDSLTGLYNTRKFYSVLDNELVRSVRYGRVFSLVYLDIDDFKHINDSFGHVEGDRVLIEVAICLQKSLRKTDVAARLGGDEFACLFPETGMIEAKTAFSKVSELVRNHFARYGHAITLTLSAGLVTFEKPPSDINEAIIIADKLMYSVKNGKKNSVAYKIWDGHA